MTSKASIQAIQETSTTNDRQLRNKNSPFNRPYPGNDLDETIITSKSKKIHTSLNAFLEK